MSARVFGFTLSFLLTRGLVLLAATSVTRDDGTVLSFEDWSSAEVRSIPSEDGEVSVVRRQCAFTEYVGEIPTTWELEMLFEPESGVMWLGKPADKHVMFRGTIFGLRAHVRTLQIMRSPASTQSVEDRFSQFLDRLVERPHIRSWPRSLGFEELKLADIYGSDVLYRIGPTARPMGTAEFSIVDARPTLGGIVLRMRTESAQILILGLDENLEVVRAEVDGKPVHVLFDGRVTNRGSHGFSGLGRVKVLANGVKIDALVTSRGYTNPGDDSGDEVTRAFAVVMPDSGEVWIGPSDCRLLRTSRGVLGFTIVNEEDLVVFPDRAVRILVTPKSAAEFRRTLEEFDSEFNANGRRWRPAMRIDVRQLVPQVESLYGFSLKHDGVFTDGEDVVLLLNTSDGNTGVHIRLSSDLSAASGSVSVTTP